MNGCLVVRRPHVILHFLRFEIYIAEAITTVLIHSFLNFYKYITVGAVCPIKSSKSTSCFKDSTLPLRPESHTELNITTVM